MDPEDVLACVSPRGRKREVSLAVAEEESQKFSSRVSRCSDDPNADHYRFASPITYSTIFLAILWSVALCAPLNSTVLFTSWTM